MVKKSETLKDRVDRRIWSIMKSSITGAKSIVDKTMNIKDEKAYVDAVLRIGLSMFITKLRDYRQFYFEDIFQNIPVKFESAKDEIEVIDVGGDGDEIEEMGGDAGDGDW